MRARARFIAMWTVHDLPLGPVEGAGVEVMARTNTANHHDLSNICYNGGDSIYGEVTKASHTRLAALVTDGLSAQPGFKWAVADLG